MCFSKVLCYGDSNTWGYDPRSFLGERYSCPWTKLLSKSYQVINCGQNGRRIPANPTEYAAVLRLLDSSQPLDACIVMLGTNDILCGLSPEQAVERLRFFLNALNAASVPLLLVAPPPVQPGTWVPDPNLLDASVQYAALCRDMAFRQMLAFTDAGEWGIELSFDGVHFTESGHRAFAKGICPVLDSLTQKGKKF